MSNYRRKLSVRKALGISAAAAMLIGVAVQSPAQDGSRTHSTWSTYLGNPDGSHFTSLTQINRSNVAQLEVAWSYDSGNERAYEFNPIVVGKFIYVIAQHTDIVALDAATGKQIWIHHPNSMGQRFEVHRGINYWQSRDGSDKRLLIPFDNHLEAIDATTGELIKSFGDGGTVDLKVGLGRDPKSMYQIQSGTPGRVFEDLIIVGSETGEDYGSASWRHPRLRCANGPHGVDFPYDSASRRVWLRHLARRRLEDCRRHKLLG